MGLFSRKKREAEEEVEDQDVLDEDEATDEDDEATDDEAVDAEEELRRKAGPFDRLTGGPFDSEEDHDEEPRRLDLGALRVPVIDGMQVRLDVEENSGRIMAVTLVHEKATLQLQVFAAPRSEGLWNAVRAQLKESVSAQGGQYDDLHTSLGPELVARIPAKTQDGREGTRLARFAGVDGPRWFLRAVFGGKALTDDEMREKLVELLRGTVVVRGDEPMAPRDLLPLKAPGTNKESETPEGQDEDPFRRGPEITEVR